MGAETEAADRRIAGRERADVDTAPKLDDPLFYTGNPFPTYQWMRREAPVYWYAEREFWALSRYEDVRWVSMRPEQFCCGRGIMIPDPDAVTPAKMDLLSFMDPPRHRTVRALIKSGFTPRRVARLEPRLRELARDIVARIQPGKDLDLANEIAAPLPTVVIAELIGAPSEDWASFRAWSDAIIGFADPEETMEPDEAHAALHAYFLELIEKRRAQPREDLLSELVQMQRGGAALSDADLYHFCWLLLVAGNETTRNLLTLLLDDPSRIPLAVEEMLRWCNPVTYMARTAVRDAEIGNQKIRAGQMLILLYGSANRDEEVFGGDAEEFRVMRHPNRHVQFGFGEHICVGAHLARLEARVMFEEMLPHLPRLQMRGEIKRTLATMLPGIREMPVRPCAV
jgi:cytochrome P450